MTAPVITTRQTPGGIDVPDGFRAFVAFENNPGIALWEKGVTPPGLDGGEAIEQTTNHNTKYRTFSPRSIVTLTPIQMECAYDPGAYKEYFNLLNVEQSVTIAWITGDAVAFHGYMKSFRPNGAQEGNKPMATVEIVPTNRDPVTHQETEMTVQAASGTGT